MLPMLATYILDQRFGIVAPRLEETRVRRPQSRNNSLTAAIEKQAGDLMLGLR
jgi:hypothetical protein